MTTTYEEALERSFTAEQAKRIFSTLERLNSSLGTEFDGELKQYDATGTFVGLYWMDMESEEWLYDPERVA